MATKGYRRIAPEERHRIVALAAEGMKYQDIAKTVDRPRGTVGCEINKAIHTGLLQPRGRLFRKPR